MTQAISATAEKYGLKEGNLTLRSAGPIAFGPDGIIFLADSMAAAIYAVELDDPAPANAPSPVDVERLDARLASYLGCLPDDVTIRDMAVHPRSHNVYLSVLRGGGASATPVLVRLAADTGTLAEVSLAGVPFARAAIEDAPAEDDARVEVRLATPNEAGEDLETRMGTLRIARDSIRTVTVTDMAYVEGTLIVAGASNEEFASTLRRIPFPFAGSARSNSLEIFHVSHGKYETASPIRTFVPYGDDASVLASYTCTPVVHFSLRDAAPGTQVKGRTVAELGAGNTPVDMVAFRRDGEEYLLVSNVRHPLMRIACKDIPGQEALTEPREPVGVPRENLPHEGVGRMANLNGSHVLMLQRDSEGMHLRAHGVATL